MPRASSRTPRGADTVLVQAVRDALAAAGDPVRAAGAQAYMKSAMPYRGVAMPVIRTICRDLFDAAAIGEQGVDAWRATVLALWRDAAYREERYAAIILTGHRTARPFQRPAIVPLYRELIVTGAWWDYVDAIASDRIGPLLRLHPARMEKTLLSWSNHEDMWLRRTSILAQLTFKGDTDLRLLYACIEPSIDRREFFLRKAIGWALRQYARNDAREVLRYVKANATRLSPLSKREALKAQLASGALRAVP